MPSNHLKFVLVTAALSLLTLADFAEAQTNPNQITGINVKHRIKYQTKMYLHNSTYKPTNLKMYMDNSSYKSSSLGINMKNANISPKNTMPFGPPKTGRLPDQKKSLESRNAEPQRNSMFSGSNRIGASSPERMARR